jgi:hypothetical protein
MKSENVILELGKREFRRLKYIRDTLPDDLKMKIRTGKYMGLAYSPQNLVLKMEGQTL